ncbi:MAG: hypothetical protein LUG62_08585 [Clostridiales bacterium]|nr:hypothetical protein [Clostridiales bacterium]
MRKRKIRLAIIMGILCFFLLGGAATLTVLCINLQLSISDGESEPLSLPEDPEGTPGDGTATATDAEASPGEGTAMAVILNTGFSEFGSYHRGQILLTPTSF